MASNGISTLTYKKQRQVAKLDAAATKRSTTGRRDTYDITELPCQYATNNNETADRVDNPNTGGLIVGRPWS